MDYTLAQYRPETFEGLAHKETVEKLVGARRVAHMGLMGNGAGVIHQWGLG